MATMHRAIITTSDQDTLLSSLPVGQFDLNHATQPAGELTTIWQTDVEEYRVVIQSITPLGEYKWMEAATGELEWGDPAGVSEPLWAPREED